MKTFEVTPRILAIIPGLALLAACGGGGGTIPAKSPTTPSGPSAPSGPSTPTGAAVSVPIHGLTPTVMAVQSGTSGAWTTVAPSGGKATFALASGAKAYTLAAMCPINGTPFRNGPGEVIVQATTADSPTIYCRGPVPGTVDASLIVETNAFPNTDVFSATQLVPGAGGNNGFETPAGADAVGSPLWAAGQADLMLGVSNGSNLVAGRIVRNVTFAPEEALTLPPMNSITDAITTTQTASAPANGNSYAYWAPAEGGFAGVGNGQGNVDVPIIPAGTAEAGDYYGVLTGGLVNGQFDVSSATSTTPSSLNLAFPPTVLTVPAPVPADLPSVNLAYNGFTITGTQYYSFALYYVTAQAPVPAGAPVVVVTASQSYLGSSTTLTMPNLSSVPGMLTPPTGQGVAVNGVDYMDNGGGMPWDNMESTTAFLVTPLPVNTQFQAVSSQGILSYNAP